MTVPGAPAGWCDAIEKWGSMDMATVLEPAITMGEQGYPIHKLTSAGVQTLLDLDSTIAWQRLCFPATELRASAAWQPACWAGLIGLIMLHRAGWRGSARLLNSMPNGNEILTPDGEGGYRGPYEGEVWYAKPELFSPSPGSRERRNALSKI